MYGVVVCENLFIDDGVFVYEDFVLLLCFYVYVILIVVVGDGGE